MIYGERRGERKGESHRPCNPHRSPSNPPTLKKPTRKPRWRSLAKHEPEFGWCPQTSCRVLDNRRVKSQGFQSRRDLRTIRELEGNSPEGSLPCDLLPGILLSGRTGGTKRPREDPPHTCPQSQFARPSQGAKRTIKPGVPQKGRRGLCTEVRRETLRVDAHIRRRWRHRTA